MKAPAVQKLHLIWELEYWCWISDDANINMVPVQLMSICRSFCNLYLQIILYLSDGKMSPIFHAANFLRAVFDLCARICNWGAATYNPREKKA